MTTPDQDSRMFYDLYFPTGGGTHLYPEVTKPWGWLVALMDFGRGYMEDEAEYLTRWFEFVKDAHTNRTKSGKPQTRGDGTPYYYHPIHVTCIAAEYFESTPMMWEARRRIDWNPFCLALSGHDLFEDTTVTRREIIDLLGKGLGTSTSNIIKGVTKPEKMPEQKGASGSDAWFRYTHGVYSKYNSTEASPEDRLVKGFDRVHNLRSLKGQPLPWRRSYLEDTSLLLSYLSPGFGVWDLLANTYWVESNSYWNDRAKSLLQGVPS